MALYWRFRRSESTLLNIGTGLFVGGTLGNLSDRIFCGEVQKGLRYNPFKAAVARMMRGTGGKNSR